MSSPKSLRLSEDYHRDLPDNVVDEILERMPIVTAARASVLSKQWRCSWLSLKRLVFDSEFLKARCRRQSNDAAISSQREATISSILLQHDNSRIHEFILKIPRLNPNQWLCHLSKNRVKKIIILNSSWSDNHHDPISWYIFSCTDLVHLHLDGFVVNHVPDGFKGVQNLKHLQLDDIKFAKPKVFGSLIANCRELSVLILKNCTGMMDDIVVDLPNLQSLMIMNCEFESLVFGKFPALKSISLFIPNSSSDTAKKTAVKYVHHLAQLTQLDILDVGAGKMGYQPVKMIRNFLKLNHLRKVKITGIRGTSAELQLIEYLLKISQVLEELWYQCNIDVINTPAERKVFKAMSGFARTSPKARVLCMEDRTRVIKKTRTDTWLKTRH